MPSQTELNLHSRLMYLNIVYSLAEDPQAKAFLETHSHLIELLYAAEGPLRRAFPKARFTSSVDGVPNPGLEESPEALLVTIWIMAEPLDALNRLHTFYKDWWIEHHSAAHGQLCFDVGFE